MADEETSAGGGQCGGSPTAWMLSTRALRDCAYCERMAWFRWREGAGMGGNAETGERQTGEPTPSDLEAPHPLAPAFPLAEHTALSSGEEGLEALVQHIPDPVGEGRVVVVDRGGASPGGGRAWRGDMLEAAAQAVLLRGSGLACDAAVVRYARDGGEIRVAVTDCLVREALDTVAKFRAGLAAPDPPPVPADPGARCARCGVALLCLPDETHLLAAGDGRGAGEVPLRRIAAPRTDAYPLVVQHQGATVGKSGGNLVVRDGGTILTEAHLKDVSQVCLFGAVQMTSQALHLALGSGVPVLFFSAAGWFQGAANGFAAHGCALRARQHAARQDPAAALAVARAIVAAKIANQREVLRRSADPVVRAAADALRRAADDAATAPDRAVLLGIEGNAARGYFGVFGRLLVAGDGDGPATPVPFAFQHRNRRPPRDPVNALLSYAYGMLAKDLAVAAAAAGFDPAAGFLHEPRAGRPALALDLMEAFRPVVADRTVLAAVNTQVVRADDFLTTERGCAIRPATRRRFIEFYEQRLDRLVTHPLFGYRVSHRRLFDIDARLLARTLHGEIPEFPAYRAK